MRIASGNTTKYIYFVAVDATDLKTRETGLTTFTVYRSRNGGTSTAMTTPTINETDATNMPGVYELLVDEDTTLGAGVDSEEMAFHITQASMAPVTRTIELYRPTIDALDVDTFAELAAVPAATSTLVDKLNWMFLLSRNKLEQTNTGGTLYADDTTTIIGENSVSDNGTKATRGEFTDPT